MAAGFFYEEVSFKLAGLFRSFCRTSIEMIKHLSSGHIVLKYFCEQSCNNYIIVDRTVFSFTDRLKVGLVFCVFIAVTALWRDCDTRWVALRGSSFSFCVLPDLLFSSSTSPVRLDSVDQFGETSVLGVFQTFRKTNITTVGVKLRFLLLLKRFVFSVNSI